MCNDAVILVSPRARWAAGAVLVILLSACCRPAGAGEAGELFAIQQVNGRLALVPRTLTAAQCGLRCWRQGDGCVEFEDYNPHGYFDGSIYVRAHGPKPEACESLQLGGRRQNFHDWEVIEFSLSQGARETSASYTIRTPINIPDVTCRVSAPSLTLLLIRHPEIRPMLDAVLTAAGEDTGFGFDPAVLAQVNPCSWDEPEGLAEAIAPLLPKLDSGDWRERDRAEQGLAALGRDGALYLLLRVDRRTLSAQQNLGIDHVVSRYPLLSSNDVQLCRQEPSRLGVARGAMFGRTE
jgi:hypothetical protein